mgnify:FL=1
MPTAMTFTSLQGDLRAYLERGEVNDSTVYNQLPRLINQAEREIAQALKIEGFLNVVTSDLIAGTSVYAKPDRWRRTVSMQFGVGVSPSQVRTPLFSRSYEYLRSYWPNVETRDQPKFYADYDYAHWLIAPTPVANYPWEIIFYEQPALLDAVNQTNWLTDYAPSTLLYRALLECEPFLKNDSRIATWKGFYGESLATLNAQDLSRIVDRSGVRQEA